MPVPTSDVFIAAVVVDLANIVFLIANPSLLPAFAPTARVTRFPRGQAPDKEGSTLSLDASVHRALQRGWQEVEGAFNYDCRAYNRLANGLFTVFVLSTTGTLFVTAVTSGFLFFVVF